VATTGYSGKSFNATHCADPNTLLENGLFVFVEWVDYVN
jgi:hypothetical protein